MLKRRKSDKLSAALGERFQTTGSRLLERLGSIRRLGYTAAWLALLGGMGYGLHFCRGYALSLPVYQQPTPLELANLPDWLQNPANRHIREAIVGAAGLQGDETVRDEQLPFTVAMRLSQCPWIRQVESVKRQPNGALRAYCEYRRPIAWVQHGGKSYLIDQQTVRLPGRYEPDQTSGTGLLLVIGAQAAPPEPGHVWDGRDLRAALRIADMLRQHPVRQQIWAILIHNYGGKTDPLLPDIELATDRPGSKIRWGHAPGEELPTEPSAEDKLALLHDYMQTYGRIDLGKPYIDIRTWPAFQPKTEPPPNNTQPNVNIFNRDSRQRGTRT